MNTKLSSKNIHSFTQQNPFTQERSLSSHSRPKIQGNKIKMSSYQSPSGYLTQRKMQAMEEYSQPVFQEKTNIPQSTYYRNQPVQGQMSIDKNRLTNLKCNSSLKKKGKEENFIAGKQKNYSCEGMLHLLSNEQDSIEKIRETAQKDKKKIQDNFNDFKQTVCNVIDDLRLSLCASIDSQFQHFFKQFKNIKAEYAKYCNVKKQFWMGREGQVQKAERKGMKGDVINYPGMVNIGKDIDNQNLLNSFIQDIKDCKRHINYREFAGIQENLLSPLLMTTQHLLSQLNKETYYNSEATNSSLRGLQERIEKQVLKFYQLIDIFVYNHTKTIEKRNKKEKENRINIIQPVEKRRENKAQPFEQVQREVGNSFGTEQFEQQNFERSNYDHLRADGKLKQSTRTPLNEKEVYVNKQQVLIGRYQQVQADRPAKNSKDTNFFSTANSDTRSKASQENNKREQPELSSNRRLSSPFVDDRGYGLSFNHQQGHSKNKPQERFVKSQRKIKSSIKLDQVRNITDRNNNRNFQSSETALCMLGMGNNKIAVGTKNGVIKIFCTKTGTKLNQLLGHKASICSLSLINQGTLMASGGDIGCCQLYIWNVREEQVYHKFQGEHQAAISSILDIDDGKHFISGSFDCCLNIYNHRKKELIQSINTDYKITVLSKCSTKDRLKNDHFLSGNLNSQISLWKISKNTFNSVTGLTLIRSINIGTYPYSIISGNINEALVVGKDNWIRVINYQKGSIDKAAELGQFSQIIPFELNRETHFIGCQKNGTMSIIDTDNLEVNSQQILPEPVGNGCPIMYSCGITKKWAFNSNYSCLYMPNHGNQSDTEIKVWRIATEDRRSVRKDQSDYFNNEEQIRPPGSQNY